MPLTRFTPAAKPYILTIRPDGRMSLNSSLSRYLDTLHARRLALFGDRATKKVVLSVAPEDDTDAKLVTFTRTTPTSTRASLEARDFLAWLHYDSDCSRRFRVDHDPSIGFTFCAKPASALRTRNTE